MGWAPNQEIDTQAAAFVMAEAIHIFIASHKKKR
jgi:hypothetical protein